MSSEPGVDAIRLCCPTCGARQEQADSCRRCKCDLSLVVPLLRQREQLRRTCLQRLAQGRYAEALAVAHRCCAVSRDPETLRLLAATQLVVGRYAAAIDNLGCGGS